jgi:peptidoglycan/LPS O-acetylase OafA/YrhL
VVGDARDWAGCESVGENTHRDGSRPGRSWGGGREPAKVDGEGPFGPRRFRAASLMAVTIPRITATGDEAGTAPGDRSFRPDVQGLRAVAILLVALFHAGIPGITGGYVGVDVFFVISGFVITGVLLRERAATSRTSLLHFYGRRARRIIPAASLVIVVTVIAAYHFLGPLSGHENAVDGQWAAVFLANFHFAASQTNYLASQQPPSALQNYWSLAVEEQFYIVYPTIFLITAGLVRNISLRARLAIVLAAVIVASYAFSIVSTSSNAPAAFFSPLTRAWELALGALIAVGSQNLRRIPEWLATLMSWAGLCAIILAGVTFTSATVYPGALVAIPVVGAGLVIAGGTAQPRWGTEQVLRQRPLQALGLISYSLYLWHWPVLMIATERQGVPALPVWDNVVWLLVATGLAVITYRVLENPVRHSTLLRQHRWASLAMAGCVIAATLVVTTYQQHRPTVNLGNLALSVRTGARCDPPPPSEVSQLRSTYLSGRVIPTAHAQRSPKGGADLKGGERVLVVGDSTSCTLLPGLEAVGPSYGMHFEDGAVVGCGIVSGTLAPYMYGGVNIVAGTSACQGEANRTETLAIAQFHPSLIVWGSTDERESIVVTTRTGTKILTSGSSEWYSVMKQRIHRRIDQFVTAGAAVVLLQEPPLVHPGVANANDVEQERMNALLRRVAAQFPHRVAVVNLQARVCPSGPPCAYIVLRLGRTKRQTAIDSVRPDGVHYLGPGALWTAKWLVPQIAEAQKGLAGVGAP